MARPKLSENKITSREKLLFAATEIIRTKGYNSTTIDDLCHSAGVSKGTFFHNFESKEAIGIAAAHHWSAVTSDFFLHAPYHQIQDPLERFLGYIKFRKEILQGEIPEFTCLVGTMIQEVYSSHPEINKACYQSLFGHAEVLESDIIEAKKLYSPKSLIDPKSLALHTQAVIQGAYILAKASHDVNKASESIDHLEHYVHLLFKK